MPEQPLLSVVIITRNESHNLPRLLESVRGVADDIVVFDSGSEDNTASLAQQAGARVFDCQWQGWSATKNKANAEAKGAWTLSLDADEALTPDSASAILSHIQGPFRNESGALRVGEINRLTRYCGQWIHHSGWHPDRKIRLWPSHSGVWKGAIHEDVLFDGNVDISRLQGHVEHHSYPHSADHLSQIERFGRVWAEDQHQRGKHTPLPLVWAKVAAQWIKTWVLKAGFLDGRAGWVIARRSAWATWRKHARLRALRAPKTPSPKRVLLARTDALGDLVVTLPMVRALKERHPEVQVDLLVRGYAIPVAKQALGVDEVVEWSSDMANDPNGAGAKAIQAGNYDALVMAYPEKSVAVAGRAAGIAIRIATGKRWHTLRRVTHRIWDSRHSSGGHEAWHGLRMLLPLGVESDFSYRRSVGLKAPKSDQKVTQILEEMGGSPVLLHPGSHGSAGNWGPHRFADLALRFAQEGHAVGITGTASERRSFEPHWPNHESIHDLGGQLDLTQLMALQAQSKLVVASSTGPLHTASAMGIPVLGLYGTPAPEWPERWAPLGPKTHILQALKTTPEGQLDLTVEEVFTAAQKALS